ncbi:hypothetical protein CFC21_037074 [Triticum aestivum]|uniref:Anaphase-promoting complex subunit 4 WD40 domain-containing protein n=2 Tax=Triticum aestivum TaxID=4565 RepID=A0A3B6ELF9_WHEAT|nr:hypothetical protein CFC21_037074 [Triticum aestivum]
MLSARSLRKASVPPSLLSDPSPGCLQPTRLAVHVRQWRRRILLRVLRLRLPRLQARDIHGRRDAVQRKREPVDSYQCAGDSCLILGTVDAYSHLIVSRLDTVAEDIDRASYSVPPRDSGVGEGSWAGLCFSPTHQSTVAVARELCKSIDIYDQDIHIRSLRALWCPSSVRFAQGSESSSILTITEGPQLSIWDFRMHNNGGCVQRISGPTGGILYSVCTSPSGLIAVGGTDRAVTVYDPRRWSALSRWVGCSKYEITGLSFSSVDQSFIYVQGVDYEITCGRWRESKCAFSFRGDSNWLGFSKCANTDVVAGWCESGSIFVADVRQDLLSVIGV